MQRRLFYTSPVDHHRAEDWPILSTAIQAAVVSACASDVTILVGDEPVFGYGTDSEEALLQVEEEKLEPRTVRIDRWCDIVGYGVVSLALGAGIQRSERRSLTRMLEKGALAGQTLLKEHKGPYDLDCGDVFGYQLGMATEDAHGMVDGLLASFEDRFYLGERWLLLDQNENVDTEAFEVMTEPAPGLAFFLTRTPDAEPGLWQSCTQGEGVIIIELEDPALEALTRRFSELRDLSILLTEHPGDSPRVTIGRCHQDDSLVVVYDPPYAPDIGAPLAFVI